MFHIVFPCYSLHAAVAYEVMVGLGDWRQLCMPFA